MLLFWSFWRKLSGRVGERGFWKEGEREMYTHQRNNTELHLPSPSVAVCAESADSGSSRISGCSSSPVVTGSSSVGVASSVGGASYSKNHASGITYFAHTQKSHHTCRSRLYRNSSTHVGQNVYGTKKITHKSRGEVKIFSRWNFPAIQFNSWDFSAYLTTCLVLICSGGGIGSIGCGVLSLWRSMAS